MKRPAAHLLTATAAAVALLGAAAAGADDDWPFRPVPIGAGPQYHPPARWPLAGGARFGGLQGGIHEGARVHIELFAHGQVIAVPGGIGVSGGRVTLYGNVLSALWHAPAWSLEPGGVIHLAGAGMTLGDVFAIWGQPLEPGRLLSFEGPVRAWVNGEPRAGDPRALTLRDRDQVVIAVNGDVEVHPAFTFKPVRR